MPALLQQLWWVALGGALGGAARFFVAGVVARLIGEALPWGTILVNTSGAIAIGTVAALADRHGLPLSAAAWQLVVLGFLGSYTTVSSFSLQTLALAQEGAWTRAGGNVALSLVLGLGGVALGYAAAFQMAIEP